MIILRKQFLLIFLLVQIIFAKTQSGLMDTMLCDGFDFPVGDKDGRGSYNSKLNSKLYDSWKVSTKFAEEYNLGIHPGIDLNGSGGGNTDIGQPVYAIGKGVVIVSEDFGSPWGMVVIISHTYLENGFIHNCYSLYAHLQKIFVKKGTVVQKRVQIGEIGTGGGSYYAHLHLEIRNANMDGFAPTFWPSSDSKDLQWIQEHYFDPEEFLKTHRHSTCPYMESDIIIAKKNDYTLSYFKNGMQKKSFEIALSQNPVGHKQIQGDLKMPEGEYYISEKVKGPFYGDYAEFLGNRMLRISYPNSFDAENGYRNGVITKSQLDAILSANNKKAIPPKNTKLGGGIVIHGWKGDWVADGNQNLTWGCISMHNRDLDSFFDIVPIGTKIIILP